MTDNETLRGWLTGRLPDDWFESEPTVTVDRDEILILGRLPLPQTAAGASAALAFAVVMSSPFLQRNSGWAIVSQER